MKSENKLLDEYHRADFHIRLNLYMLHRDLRRDFIAIDRADLNGKTTRRNHEEKVALEVLRPCHCS